MTEILPLSGGAILPERIILAADIGLDRESYESLEGAMVSLLEDDSHTLSIRLLMDYSLVSAALAADVLQEGLTRDALGERQLERYERAWQQRLGPELEAQLDLRLLANRLTDREIDELFDLAATDGVMPIVRRTARFNHHGDLIRSLLKHPPARRILFRRLLPGRRAVAH